MKKGLIRELRPDSVWGAPGGTRVVLAFPRVPRTPAQGNESGFLLSVHRAALGFSPRGRPKNKDRSNDRSLFFGAPGGTRFAARAAPWSVAALTCHWHVIQYRSSFESLQHAKKRQQFNPRIELLPFGAPGGTRTRDLLIRSQTLYPAELRAHMPSINDSFTIILDWRTKVKAFPQIPALSKKASSRPPP